MIALFKLPTKFGSINFNKPDNRADYLHQKGMTDIELEGYTTCTTLGIKHFFQPVM